ncbi:MAG: class I adenylate-forming enzyme family protein, partial [Henriciella sp.]
MAADGSPAWPVMSIAEANEALAAPGTSLAVAEGEINGVTMRYYPEAPPTIRFLVEASKEHGDRDFLIYGEERATYSSHFKAVSHFAHVLKDQFGVQKGDRVAIVMRNYPQWSVAFFAALAVGAIATPMNSWWTGDELEYGLKNADVKVAVVDPQIYERIREHMANLPELETVVIARETEEERNSPGVYNFEDFVGEPSDWLKLKDVPLPDVDLGPDDDATLMYTSGTTGKPKGALATHRAVISNFLNSMSCQARMFLRRGEALPEPDPNEQRATLLAIPFFHATGAFAVLIPTLLRGDKIVSMYKWDAGEALPIIENEKITAIGGVPAIAWQVLEHPDRDKYDL